MNEWDSFPLADAPKADPWAKFPVAGQQGADPWAAFPEHTRAPTQSGLGSFASESLLSLRKGVGDIYRGAKETITEFPERYRAAEPPPGVEAGPLGRTITGPLYRAEESIRTSPAMTALGEMFAATGFTPLRPLYKEVGGALGGGAARQNTQGSLMEHPRYGGEIQELRGAGGVSGTDRGGVGSIEGATDGYGQARLDERGFGRPPTKARGVNLEGSEVGLPQTPPQKPPAGSAAPATGSGKIIDLTGMGKGMTDRLYEGLFDSLQKGKDTFAGIKDPVLAKAKATYDKGLIKSPEDLKNFVNAGYDEKYIHSSSGFQPSPEAQRIRAGLPDNLDRLNKFLAEPDEITPVPRELGAAVPPPSQWSRDAQMKYELELHGLNHSWQKHAQEMLQSVQSTPPEFKNAPAQDRMYTLLAKDDFTSLTPEEKAYSDERLQPMRDEIADLRRQLKLGTKALDLEPHEADKMIGVDATSLPRLVKGKHSILEMMEQGDDVLLGQSMRDTPSLHDTKYDTLVNENTGERQVFSKHDGYIRTLDGESIKADHPSIGDPLKRADGSTWRVNRGWPDEIEQALGKQHGEMYDYNVERALAYTRASMRHKLERVNIMRRIKDDPEMGLKYTGFSSKVPKGLVQLKFPGMQRYAAPKRVAEMFEDATPRVKGNWEKAFEKVSSKLTQSIFWTPIPHTLNEAQLAFQNTGWHSLDPRRYPESMRDFVRGAKEVATGGKLYSAIWDAPGSPLHALSTKNATLPRQMAEAFGEHWKADPKGTGFADFAKRFGLTVGELYDGWYRTSSKALWHSSDAIATWRVIRNLREVNKRAGRDQLDLAGVNEATKMTTKDISDYFVPSRVWEGPGGRLASQILKYSPLNIFGRYRYGLAKSLYQMGKDIAVGKPADKAMALGKIINLGIAFAAAEYANDLYQKGTGDDKHKLSPHGTMSVLDPYIKKAQGKNLNPLDVARTVGISPAPIVGAAAEGASLLSGGGGAHFPFGQPIRRLQDTPWAQAAQVGDTALGHIAPYAMAEQLAGAPNNVARALQLTTGLGSAGFSGDFLSPGTAGVGPLEHLATGRPMGSKPKPPKKKRPRL